MPICLTINGPGKLHGTTVTRGKVLWLMHSMILRGDNKSMTHMVRNATQDSYSIMASLILRMTLMSSHSGFSWVRRTLFTNRNSIILVQHPPEESTVCKATLRSLVHAKWCHGSVSWNFRETLIKWSSTKPKWSNEMSMAKATKMMTCPSIEPRTLIWLIWTTNADAWRDLRLTVRTHWVSIQRRWSKILSCWTKTTKIVSCHSTRGTVCSSGKEKRKFCISILSSATTPWRCLQWTWAKSGRLLWTYLSISHRLEGTLQCWLCLWCKLSTKAPSSEELIPNNI